MKRVFIILAVLMTGATYLANAQSEKPEIVTDRPDQTESPSLVPKGGLQVELGAAWENDRDHGVKYTNITYSTMLMKYVVNENFELRLISEYLGERARNSEMYTTRVSGLSPLALGVKIKISDENGIWPQAALIGHINLK